MGDAQQQGSFAVKVLYNIIEAGWTIKKLRRTAPIIVALLPGAAATTAILKIFVTTSDSKLLRMYDGEVEIAVEIAISGRKQGAGTPFMIPLSTSTDMCVCARARAHTHARTQPCQAPAAASGRLQTQNNCRSAQNLC